LERIKRFSNWLEKNYYGINFLGEFSGPAISLESVIVSSGEHSFTPKVAWQQSAIQRGMWPDSEPVYKLNESGDKLTSDWISSCYETNSCGQLSKGHYVKKYDPTQTHIHHIHVKVK